jgi:hypothetical protein
MGRKRDAAVFLGEALRKICADFRALPLFTNPRSEALYHYVAALEAESLRESLLLPLEPRALGNWIHRRAVESSCIAVPAIFQYCSPHSGSDVAFDRATFLQAQELHEFSYRYEQINFSNQLAEKGLFNVHAAQKEQRVTFSYASGRSDEAGTFRKARELHELFSAERLTVDPSEIEAKGNPLKERLSKYVKRVEPEACEFDFVDALFPLMRDLGEALVKTVPDEMPSHVRVGNLSFADLLEFWGALLAMSVTYQWATHIAADGDIHKFPIRSAVLCIERTQATDIISGVAGIPRVEVEKLIHCYTYDTACAANVPILQPFLPVGQERIC